MGYLVTDEDKRLCGTFGVPFARPPLTEGAAVRIACDDDVWGSDSEAMAVLLNPCVQKPRVFMFAGSAGAVSRLDGTLRIQSEVHCPDAPLEERISLAISHLVKADPGSPFRDWADGWRTDRDRSYFSARRVMERSIRAVESAPHDSRRQLGCAWVALSAAACKWAETGTKNMGDDIVMGFVADAMKSLWSCELDPQRTSCGA